MKVLRACCWPLKLPLFEFPRELPLFEFQAIKGLIEDSDGLLYMCLHTTICVRMLLCIYPRTTIYIRLRWPSAAVAGTDYRRSPVHRQRQRQRQRHRDTGTGTGPDTDTDTQSVVNSFLDAQSLFFLFAHNRRHVL